LGFWVPNGTQANNQPERAHREDRGEQI